MPEISKNRLIYGYALVVLYGNSLEKAYIDIISSSISLPSKIVSITKPNQVLVGESIYNILLSSESISDSEFIETSLDPQNGNMFLVLTLKVCIVYEYHN